VGSHFQHSIKYGSVFVYSVVLIANYLNIVQRRIRGQTNKFYMIIKYKSLRDRTHNELFFV